MGLVKVRGCPQYWRTVVSSNSSCVSVFDCWDVGVVGSMMKGLDAVVVFGSTRSASKNRRKYRCLKQGRMEIALGTI